MTTSISSPAFKEGEQIPAEYTCQGKDISPPLAWHGIPMDTQSLALIMDDPDAPGGTFTHWVLFNLKIEWHILAAALTTESQLPGGIKQGKNDFGRFGYGGPCPPPGRPHRYRFTLYALDQKPDLEAGAFREQLIDAMKGHILDQGHLTGTYQR